MKIIETLSKSRLISRWSEKRVTSKTGLFEAVFDISYNSEVSEFEKDTCERRGLLFIYDR